MRWIQGIVLMTCVGAAGCDRRSEGQLMGRQPQPPIPNTVKTAESTSIGGRSTAEGPKRCMVPLPAEPPPTPEPAKNCPRDPVFGGVTLDTAEVSFPGAKDAPTLEVELALAPDARERGLMYRTHLGQDRGMLFDFPGPARVQSFWMRNTCVPLDMMFIAEDGFITGIQENVPTLNDRSRSIPCEVNYVLEVNAGWSRANGVAPGQKVKLPKRT